MLLLGRGTSLRTLTAKTLFGRLVPTITTSPPAATVWAASKVPVSDTSIVLPTSACRPSVPEFSVFSSQVKLYLVQRPLAFATTACMLPVVPA